MGNLLTVSGLGLAFAGASPLLWASPRRLWSFAIHRDFRRLLLASAGLAKRFSLELYATDRVVAYPEEAKEAHFAE